MRSADGVQTDLRRSALSIGADGLRMTDLVSREPKQIHWQITRAFGRNELQHLQPLLRDLERCVMERPPGS